MHMHDRQIISESRPPRSERDGRGGCTVPHPREPLLGDPVMRIDSTERVEKLDRNGVRLVLRIAGAQSFQLEHTWSEGRGRTHYVSVLDLGARSRPAQPVNAYLRSRVPRPAMAEAWLQHNVEGGADGALRPGLHADTTCRLGRTGRLPERSERTRTSHRGVRWSGGARGEAWPTITRAGVRRTGR